MLCDQSQGQQSQQSHPSQGNQQDSSRGSAPYSSTFQGGCGSGSSFRGAFFSCGQLGHKSGEYPLNTSSGPSRGVAISKPTMGDACISHRFFAVIENCQSKHQGAIVKATSTLHSTSSIVLIDSGASDLLFHHPLFNNVSQWLHDKLISGNLSQLQVPR